MCHQCVTTLHVRRALRVLYLFGRPTTTSTKKKFHLHQHGSHTNDLSSRLCNTSHLMGRKVLPPRAGMSSFCTYQWCHDSNQVLFSKFSFPQAYSVYLRIFYSGKASQQKDLKVHILATKKELLETSSQDQFAKWAKLRRKVDKGLADLDALSTFHKYSQKLPRGSKSYLIIDSELSVVRTKFSVQFSTALWTLTTGARFIVGWWYRRTPVFYLPSGWFGPVTWWLSLPFAPAGTYCSVSVYVSWPVLNVFLI